MASARLSFLVGTALVTACTLLPFAAVHAQDGGTLAKIKASGSISFGYRESSFGFSYLDANLKPVGDSIEICNRIVEAVKTELRMPDVEVRCQAVTSGNRIPLVVNGTVVLVETGRAQAFVLDDILLAGQIANARNPKDFIIAGESLRTENQSLMFRKDDPEFKALVDRVVGGMMKSGEMEKLYDKWFMSPIPPKNINTNYPLNAETRDAFAHPSSKGI